MSVASQVRFLLQRLKKLSMPSNPLDEQGVPSPLMLAAKGRHASVVLLLIGSDLYNANETGANGETALHAVLSEWLPGVHLAPIRTIVRRTTGVPPGGLPHSPDEEEATLTIMRGLLEGGADLLAPTLGWGWGCYGTMPIHTAAFFGNLAAVMFLVEVGNVPADQPSGGSDRVTALHLAATYGYHDLCLYLLDTCLVDPSPFTCNRGRATPLHMALVADHIDIAMLLVKWGADVDAKDAFSMSPLQMHLTWACDDPTPEGEEDLTRPMRELMLRTGCGNVMRMMRHFKLRGVAHRLPVDFVQAAVLHSTGWSAEASIHGACPRTARELAWTLHLLLARHTSLSMEMRAHILGFLTVHDLAHTGT